MHIFPNMTQFLITCREF